MSMTKQRLEAWGARYGLTLKQVYRLQRLWRWNAYLGTNFCNGGPHPDAKDKTDKSECSSLWDAQREKIQIRMLAVAEEYGFHDVDFGVGLYPTLEKDGNSSIVVPLD